MKQNFVIKIKKPSQAEGLLWAILVLPFLFSTLIELLHLPNLIKYSCDIAWLWLLLLMYLQRGRKTWEQRLFGLVIVGYLLFTAVGYVLNYQSLLYYLWGVRNNFRMFVVFLAVIAFCKETTRADFLKFFDSVFWINVALCVFQFFVLGRDQDNLGGIFGIEKGCNGYLNNYFVIVAIKSILEYLYARDTLTDCVMKCGAMLLISVLAELKYFYVEFVVIIVMAVLLTDFSWKKVLVIVGGFAGVILTARLLIALFPEFEGFFSLGAMLEAASSDRGYTNTGDINRLNAVAVISRRFLKTWPEQLVGMGLGNCDTSGFAFLVSPFYHKYYELNYTWFTTAFTFLETGYVGLIFLFGFFVLVFFRAGAVAKRRPQDKTYCQMAQIGAVCCAMIAIYNSTLRNEAGYMLYIILALPFIRNLNSAEERRLT